MQVIDIPVNGNNSRAVTIPKGYKYLLIENPTGYAVTVYTDLVNQDVQHRLAFCSIYTILEVVLPNQGLNSLDILVSWSGSGTDKITLKATAEKTGSGQTLISPGGSSSVIVSGDGVGLAKAAQLPAALSGAGNLKVDVAETAGLTAGALNLDGSKNLGVTLQNAVPAGSNHIGEVAVSSLPALVAGAATIGNVGLVAGAAKVGSVDIASTTPIIQPAGTPTIYNVTCTLANTEYSQALPANTKRFTVMNKGNNAATTWKMYFASAAAATMDFPGNMGYSEEKLLLAAQTLYFKSSNAGDVIQILAWV